MGLIVDAHVHIWNLTAPPLPGLVVQPTVPVRVEALAAHMAAGGIDRAVLVQPIHPGADHGAVRAAAAGSPAFRVVAAPPVDPSGMAAFLADDWGWLRGLRLRPRIPAERPAFQGAVAPLLDRLSDRRHPLCVLGTPDDADRVCHWARMYPAMPVVLDHALGTDLRQGAALAPLLALADEPNVYLKLSGLHYVSALPWPHPDTHDALRRIAAAFGPQRMIWGGDFPHGLLFAPCRPPFDLLAAILPEAGAGDLAAVLGHTALRLWWEDAA